MCSTVMDEHGMTCSAPVSQADTDRLCRGRLISLAVPVWHGHPAVDCLEPEMKPKVVLGLVSLTCVQDQPKSPSLSPAQHAAAGLAGDAQSPANAGLHKAPNPQPVHADVPLSADSDCLQQALLLKVVWPVFAYQESCVSALPRELLVSHA